MKRLDPEDEAAAMRTLELMTPLTLYVMQESHGQPDRLALRVAMRLLLGHLEHPDDDAAAARIEHTLRVALG